MKVELAFTHRIHIELNYNIGSCLVLSGVCRYVFIYISVLLPGVCSYVFIYMHVISLSYYLVCVVMFFYIHACYIFVLLPGVCIYVFIYMHVISLSYYLVCVVISSPLLMIGTPLRTHICIVIFGFLIDWTKKNIECIFYNTSLIHNHSIIYLSSLVLALRFKPFDFFCFFKYSW